MPQRITAILLFCLLISPMTPSLAAYSYDPTLHWRTLHSAHFEIHFHDGEQALAQKLARIGERVRPHLTEYFQWSPVDKTQVVLVDRMDYSNGSATPLPRNTMELIVTPPDDITFLDNYDDYLQYLFTHEYTHIVHIDKARRGPLILRKVFGRFPWLFPNHLQPPWIIEGIATYQESQTSPDVGRGNNAYYRGLMRNEVVAGLKPLRQVNQPTTDWPMGTSYYLYGVYYFNFLKSRYGDKGIQRWVNEYSDNLLPYFINNTSRRTFGKDLDGMWKEFDEYLQRKFKPDIERRTRLGLSQATQLSHSGYYTGYPVALNNGDVYYVETDLESEPRLMLLPQGHGPAQHIADVHGVHFDVHPQQGVVMAQLDYTHSTNEFSDLYRIDPHTHRVRQITHGKRYTYATWSPDGTQILAVHNGQGNKRLDLLDSEGKRLDTLWQGSNGEIISQPQWSPDGKSIVAAVWRRGNDWNLEQFNIALSQWQSLTEDKHIETQPHYTADGQHLLFSADYDGAFNIYQMDLSNGEIIQLTNVMGGAMIASPAAQDKGIYYMDLNRNGYDLYYLAQDNYFGRQYTPPPVQQAGTAFNPMVKTALTSIPTTTNSVAATKPQSNRKSTESSDAAPDTDYLITDYSALNKIAPTAWFPYLLKNDERSELGITTYGNDPLFRHIYSLVYAYDFHNQWSVGSFNYIYDRWNPTVKLSGVRDMLSARDSNNKLLGFTRSDTVTAELLFPFIRHDRQWSLHLGYVGQHETNQKNIDPLMPIVNLTDKLLGAAVTYNSARRYPRSISLDDGQRLRLVYEDSDLFTSNYQGKVKTVDWRAYFRLTGEQVLATRVMLGRGGDAGSRPFRLGGTTDGFQLVPPGAAIIAATDAVFNRRNYALRGYPTGLPALIGRDINLAELAWRFPVARIERGWMAPPVGLQQIYGSLFYNTGKADNNRPHGDEYHNGIGLELNTELVLGYGLPLSVRMGYAHGYQTGGEDQYYMSVGATF